MLETAVAAILGGLARSAGERLLQKPAQQVQLQKLQNQVAELQVAHDRTQAELRMAVELFIRLVERTDGLAVTGSSIRYSLTPTTTSATEAVMNLDREVEDLLAHETRMSSGINKVSSVAGANDPLSIMRGALDGIQEEIDEMRRLDL